MTMSLRDRWCICLSPQSERFDGELGHKSEKLTHGHPRHPTPDHRDLPGLDY